MIISYVILPDIEFTKYYIEPGVSEERPVINRADSSEYLNEELEESVEVEPSRRLALLRSLLKYMIPFFLVYFAQYFINQGLFELTYFRNSFISDHKTQYRWYNVAYQLTVFISRSTIQLIHIKWLPIFPIFQLLNVAVFLSNLYLDYIPSIWFIFALILWEGLVGGVKYIYWKLSCEILS
jgi:battenin